MEQQYSQYVFWALFVLVGYVLHYFKDFFRSFSQEKGKNTAAKQDTKEITLLQELAKNAATKQDIAEITTKIENVKWQVQYEHAQRSGWVEQQKLALTNFFNEYIQWTDYSLRNLNSVVPYASSPEVIRKLIDDLNIQKIKTDKSFQNLQLMEDNDEVFNINLSVVFFAAQELHVIVEKFLHKMEQISIRYKAILAQSESKASIDDEWESVLKSNKKIINEKEQEVIRGSRTLKNLIREKLKEKYGIVEEVIDDSRP